MDVSKQIILDFINETNSESALVLNSGGSLKISENILHGDSVAAMGDAILSMCDKFLEDLEKGILKQVFLKTNTNIIVFNKINSQTSLVVFSGLGTNLGLFLHKVEELATNLQ